MKIFVFGAGASLSAQHSETYKEAHPERAPLVDQLFNEQYKSNLLDGMSLDLEECRSFVSRQPLEKWLTNRWNAIDSLNTDRKKRSEYSWFGNVNLYIWNVLNTVSKTYPMAQGYSYLLKKLHDNDEEFGLISFNYDTLLDKSYQDIFHRSLSSKEAYLTEKYIKLHGSVNWFLKSRDEDGDLSYNRHHHDIGIRVRAIAENMYNGTPMNMDKLEILDPTHSSLSSIQEVMSYFNEGYFYPLLFMPLTGKAYNTISDFSDVMIEKAKEMFNIASEVYLIGYSASDDLIHELLKQVAYGTKLHVVGRDVMSVQKIADHTTSQNPNLEIGGLYHEGFSAFTSNYK